MTVLNVAIRLHEEPGFADPEFGPCVTLDRHDAKLLLGEFDGVAGSGDRCQAITEARARCPKDGAVAIIVNGSFTHLCGGHYGVHRRGRRLLEVIVG